MDLTYDPPADRAAYLARAAATPFPPRDWRDARAYRHHEVMAGYQERTRGGPKPGDEASSSFRWGWAQADRELRKRDDGLDLIRDQVRRSLAAER